MSKIKFNAKVFEAIESVANRFRGLVDSITATYVSETNKIDAAGYIPEKALSLKAEQEKIANEKIADARSSSSGLIMNEIDKIRDAVRIWAAELPNKDLTSAIQAIKNSGVDVTRAEFDALLLQNDGSYWSSKILSKLASDFGFTYSYPSLDLLNHKITELQNGCLASVNNYLGNQDAWTLDRSTDPLKAVIHSTAFNYFDNGSFRQARDFLLNNVSTLYSLSDDSIMRDLKKSKQDSMQAEQISNNYTDDIEK